MSEVGLKLDKYNISQQIRPDTHEMSMHANSLFSAVHYARILSGKHYSLHGTRWSCTVSRAWHGGAREESGLNERSEKEMKFKKREAKKKKKKTVRNLVHLVSCTRMQILKLDSSLFDSVCHGETLPAHHLALLSPAAAKCWRMRASVCARITNIKAAINMRRCTGWIGETYHDNAEWDWIIFG